MWYNVVKNFDLQSVIADDLAILTSINNVFLSFEQGNPTYQHGFLVCDDTDSTGNFYFVNDIGHHNIQEIEIAILGSLECLGNN